MIEDLINLAADLVKRAWFAYPLKENDEEFTQEEEEKEMKDSIEARDPHQQPLSRILKKINLSTTQRLYMMNTTGPPLGIIKTMNLRRVGQVYMIMVNPKSRHTEIHMKNI